MENDEQIIPTSADQQQDEQVFSEPGFWEKLGAFGQKAGIKISYLALVLYYMMKSPATSPKDRALIVGALVYFISPLDGIPDGIPSLGFADDFTVLFFALKAVINNVTPEVMTQAKEKMQSLFTNLDEEKLNNLL